MTHSNRSDRLVLAAVAARRHWERLVWGIGNTPIRGFVMDDPGAIRDAGLWKDLALTRARHAAVVREEERGWRIHFD